MVSIVVFSSSLITCITSLIIRSGVDAPATIPIISSDCKLSRKNLPIFSMVFVCSHFFLQISSKRTVFALIFEPITKIFVHFSARSAASFCRCLVVSQMVSYTVRSDTRRSSACTIPSYCSRDSVVCATIHALAVFGAFSASAAVSSTRALSPACPCMPTTSGWFALPAI